MINYDRIPYAEKRSTGEHVVENAFYMPKSGEDSVWYSGYDANDFFGMKTERIIPLSTEKSRTFDW